MALDRSDRAVLAAGRAIRARERKEAKKARPKTVRPDAPGQRQPRKHDKPYLAWIRRLPCVCQGRGICAGPVEAAHLRFSDAGAGRLNPGLQQKPDDRLTTPLCQYRSSAPWPPSHCPTFATKHRSRLALAEVTVSVAVPAQHGGAERGFWRIVDLDPAEITKALSAAYDAGQDGTEVVLRFQRRGESR